MASVLSELGDDFDPGHLVETSTSASILWAPGVDNLLEYVGAGDRAVVLNKHVWHRARNFSKLLPGTRVEGAPSSNDWRLFMNTGVGADL